MSQGKSEEILDFKPFVYKDLQSFSKNPVNPYKTRTYKPFIYEDLGGFFFFVRKSSKSTTRQQYPCSLSYQARSLRNLLFSTFVERQSITEEYSLPI